MTLVQQPRPITVTEKYPSIRKTGERFLHPPLRLYYPRLPRLPITLKYPSDTEDGGAIPSPVPLHPDCYYQKIPVRLGRWRRYSPAPVPSPTPIAVTMKCPSGGRRRHCSFARPGPHPSCGDQKYPSIQRMAANSIRPCRPSPPGSTHWYETMKAPSGTEDGGTIDMKLPPRPNPDDQLIHTMKAPSDTEDGGGNNQIW
ncbi:MAG: hypothetical protein R2857_11655 [Vampirovibrionales bacterium]